jgi:hypothetical protein
MHHKGRGNPADAPIFAIAAVPYFFYVDRHMADARDGYWPAEGRA